MVCPQSETKTFSLQCCIKVYAAVKAVELYTNFLIYQQSMIYQQRLRIMFICKAIL